MQTKLILLLILSLATVNGFPQEKSGRVNDIVKEPGKPAQTEALISSRQFVFEARTALPAGGSPIDLTTNRNFVKFQPDVIESYMPFFGRAYSGAGYGEQGLHFKGQPEEFIIERNRKNHLITTVVKDEYDSFRLFLTVSPNGNATLAISSNNRETMRYRGEISARIE